MHSKGWVGLSVSHPVLSRGVVRHGHVASLGVKYGGFHGVGPDVRSSSSNFTSLRETAEAVAEAGEDGGDGGSCIIS